MSGLSVLEKSEFPDRTTIQAGNTPSAPCGSVYRARSLQAVSLREALFTRSPYSGSGTQTPLSTRQFRHFTLGPAGFRIPHRRHGANDLRTYSEVLSTKAVREEEEQEHEQGRKERQKNGRKNKMANRDKNCHRVHHHRVQSPLCSFGIAILIKETGSGDRHTRARGIPRVVYGF
jgi:hypothetical protein